MNKYTIRDITEIGIFVGLALILNISIFTFHIMPNAGSISFTMVPLFIIALRKNWWKTLIASAFVYGILACVIDGYGIASYPFDYMFAYGGITIVSLFRNKIFKQKYGFIYLIISVIIATVIRLFSSTISSMVVYQYKFIPAIIYNATYIPVTGALCLAILLALYIPLKTINIRYPSEK